MKKKLKYLDRIWGGILWKKFIFYIESSIENNYNIDSNVVFLELGAREGYISEIFRENFKIIVSDISYNMKCIEKSTPEFEYKNLNCLDINLQDESVDIVVFKSVLGGLKSAENQIVAFQEIHRVLKPNGLVIFAENVRGSLFHRLLRALKHKNRLNYWRYISNADFSKIVEDTNFKVLSAEYKGVLSGLGFTNIFFDSILSKLDKYILQNFIRGDKRALLFSCLQKK